MSFRISCCAGFSRDCPKVWENLPLSENPKVRFCNVCNKNVFWCDGQEDLHAIVDELRVSKDRFVLKRMPRSPWVTPLQSTSEGD